MKIGLYPFTNTLTFRLRSEEETHVVFGTPAEISRMAQHLDIDCGLIPVVDIPRLEPKWDVLGPYGIAIDERAISVLLFSQVPMRELNGKTIRLTVQSRTSIALLRLLLEKKYTLSKYTFSLEVNEPYDAILEIGDRALAFSSQQRFPYVFDLGEEWVQWQKRSFVFALWMVRRDLDPKRKEHIVRKIEKALNDYSQKSEEIVRTYFGRPREDVLKYLKTFRYNLTEADFESIQFFLKALQAE